MSSGIWEEDREEMLREEQEEQEQTEEPHESDEQVRMLIITDKQGIQYKPQSPRQHVKPGAQPLSPRQPSQDDNDEPEEVDHFTAIRNEASRQLRKQLS
jgi:hypothetical protein